MSWDEDPNVLNIKHEPLGNQTLTESTGAIQLGSILVGKIFI